MKVEIKFRMVSIAEVVSRLPRWSSGKNPPFLFKYLTTIRMMTLNSAELRIKESDSKRGVVGLV